MSNLDLFSTGPAGLALARAGADHGLLHRMCDYLIGRQMPDAGWTFGEEMRHSDVDASSYAAACLAAVDPERHREAVVRAGRYFREIAGPDGGFPTYVKGDPSEVGMTAAAVSALAWNGTRHGDLLDRTARCRPHGDGPAPAGRRRRHGGLGPPAVPARAGRRFHRPARPGRTPPPALRRPRLHRIWVLLALTGCDSESTQ
ncbi:prenyltransferase/squalene oxidase repeat-containing protein [Streptomyces sp. KS 21]|uniref:prenyltransferase/squalene oxidase repeat-containing protein n=1 Tax=Streptomyces sp. KS 21 TaxID=2485150 RepID=UPI0010638BAE|nr:prenyltransferase/squalene oxidase repeat-containing protein [Streptomyces sp. KS 21]